MDPRDSTIIHNTPIYAPYSPQETHHYLMYIYHQLAYMNIFDSSIWGRASDRGELF